MNIPCSTGRPSERLKEASMLLNKETFDRIRALAGPDCHRVEYTGADEAGIYFRCSSEDNKRCDYLIISQDFRILDNFRPYYIDNDGTRYHPPLLQPYKNRLDYFYHVPTRPYVRLYRKIVSNKWRPEQNGRFIMMQEYNGPELNHTTIKNRFVCDKWKRGYRTWNQIVQDCREMESYYSGVGVTIEHYRQMVLGFTCEYVAI